MPVALNMITSISLKRTGIAVIPLLFCLFCSTSVYAVEQYRLNPGDKLKISVWNEEALQLEVMVLPDGTISFPLVGIVDASQKTPGEVQAIIKEKLSRLIPDPEINLSVIGVDGNSIFVIGKVVNPGKYPMNSRIDVMQALSLAGGFTTYANPKSIRIIRRSGDSQKVLDFDYTDIENGKRLETNILLNSGDTIIVP